MANKLCARQTASLLSKKGFALFGQSPPARPCGKQARAGDFAQSRYQSRRKTWISKLMVTSSAVSAARRCAPARGVFQ